MTTRFQPTGTPATDQNFRTVEGLFPVREIANGVVAADQIKAGAVTDAKLAQPVIEGAFSATATIEAGEGFTVERPSTGVYKITLSTELATNAVIVANPRIGGGAIGILTSAPAKKVFELNCRLNAETLGNTAVNFLIKAS